MAHDDSAPATKQDIAMLMESIGKLYDDIANFKSDVEENIASSEERMKRHFDVVAENLRKDVLGANRDEVVVHTGLLAA